MLHNDSMLVDVVVNHDDGKQSEPPRHKCTSMHTQNNTPLTSSRPQVNRKRRRRVIELNSIPKLSVDVNVCIEEDDEHFLKKHQPDLYDGSDNSGDDAMGFEYK